jgi:hypothetical protein
MGKSCGNIPYLVTRRGNTANQKNNYNNGKNETNRSNDQDRHGDIGGHYNYY